MLKSNLAALDLGALTHKYDKKQERFQDKRNHFEKHWRSRSELTGAYKQNLPLQIKEWQALLSAFSEQMIIQYCHEPEGLPKFV